MTTGEKNRSRKMPILERDVASSEGGPFNSGVRGGKLDVVQVTADDLFIDVEDRMQTLNYAISIPANRTASAILHAPLARIRDPSCRVPDTNSP